MAPTNSLEWRELARRTGNGVEVALLLHANRVKVAVSNDRLCHHVELDLADDALERLQGPFADAAARLRATDLQAALAPRTATDEFWGFSSSK